MKKADLPPVIHPDDIAGLVHIAVDKPLRTLITMISETAWMKTFGCCAGMAIHKSRGFYIIAEVKTTHLNTFMRWLSLTHKIGCDRHRQKREEVFSLFRAELEVPNLFYDTVSPTGAQLGPQWLRFRITLANMEPITKATTKGTITALELALRQVKEETSSAPQSTPDESRKGNPMNPEIRDSIFKGVFGGAYICPQTNKMVASWSTQDDNKFICEGCGKIHTKASCNAVTAEEAERAGFFEQPKIKDGVAGWYKMLSEIERRKNNGT